MAMNTTQTMELTQATQTLKFLEEERRKDKTAIAVLQEQAKSQEEQLSQQTALIQDLQITLSGIQGLISRAANFEQTVSNYKNEMVFLLDQREEAWRKERTETARLHKIEMKGIVDQLGQLDKEAQVLRRHDEDIKARQAEEKRLSEAIQQLESTVADLGKRSDDRVQAVTYLEEQRRADNRRIAELEQETTELRKRAEAQAAKLLLLEDTIGKHKAHIDGAVQQLKEFEKSIEEMRVAEFRREQAVKKYLDQAERVRQEMEEWRSQTQRFVEQYTLTKRGLEKLEGFQARQEKRQNEVAEMQRLAEDRVRRQWEEWQTRQDKKQKKNQVIMDEQRMEQGKVNQEHGGRIAQLETQTGAHQTQIETLFDARRMDAHRDLEAVQGTVERAEQALAQAREAWHGE